MTGIAGYLQQVDVKLLLLINHARSPALDFVMKTVSDFNLFLPLIAAFIIYRLVRGGTAERIMWIVGILAVISSDAMCARVLKPIIGRYRPYLDIDGLYVFKGHKWLIIDPGLRSGFKPSLSWPSCHAFNIWTAASYIFGFRIAEGLAVALLAVMVCYSRVYLGVHYPLDTLGGMILGILWGLLFAWLARLAISAMDNKAS